MKTCDVCGASNPADSRFCASCGSPLAAVCRRCGAPLPEAARFCPACGEPVEPAAAPGTERKLVTVVFADVTGSTTLGEQLDPERLREVLDAYFSAMRQEIVAEGGTVEKFIGDAVMAAFGVPSAHEDDPARALRASLRMLRRMGDVNAELAPSYGVALAIRIGVNTGDVLATIDPRPGEPMVTGDVVNAAARLQTAAAPGTIVAGERTVRSARGFRYEALGPLDLKGKTEPVVAFRVVEETGIGIERGVPGLTAPMVGRDSELEVLRSVYRRAVGDRRPNLVTVYGEAGVGKSRLTREFLSWTCDMEERPLVLQGRCLPYGDGITYWPLAEILKGHAGILDTDPPELAVEKVRKAGRDLLTSEFAPDPVRATAALAYTVGLEDPDTTFAGADPRAVRDELHAAWRSFFSALAASTPVVTVIEDIHWADPVLLDLLEDLAERVQGPAMYVCPSRPELSARRPGWGGGRRNASAVALDPLSAGDSERLITLLLSVDDLPPSVHTRILERAEGNPFYLEEIIHSLIDGGFLFREDERWRAVPGIGDVEIPDTVQAVLASRIDLLGVADKLVLQSAAVVGRAFWPGPVAQLTGTPEPDLLEAFRRLEDRELVYSRPGSTWSGQPEYLFKHILTRDVAYESLPRKDRAAAHRAVAAWVERTAGDRTGEFAELLAYHYSTAVASVQDGGRALDPDLRGAALRWLLRASRDARMRAVVKKAERMAEEALALASDALERTDALEALAEAFFAQYMGDLAWRYYREAATLRADAEPPDGARVAYLAARACEVPQRWPGSMRSTLPPEAEVEELYRLALRWAPPGDTPQRVRLLGLRAGWPFGYPDAARTEAEFLEYQRAGIEAAEMALRIGEPDLASGALDQANAVWVTRGWYGRALPLWERRREIIPQVTDVLEIGDFYSMGAWMFYELGRYAEAVEVSDAGIRVMTGRGANVELHVRSWRLVALHRLGEWDEALVEFERIQDLLEDRREDPPYFVTHAFAAAAAIHEIRGDRVQSDRLASVLMRLSGEGHSRLFGWHLRFLILRGELQAAGALPRSTTSNVHAGDAFESESELLAASGVWQRVPEVLAAMREYAAAADSPPVLAFADRLEGRAALAGGDAAAALPLLERAAVRFGEMGAVWERALTELDLARALADLGRASDAAAAAANAAATFEALGCGADLARAQATRRGTG
jgi:class 3 adenylate cyclase/tetratricopeptide (TPR) repeat protein